MIAALHPHAFASRTSRAWPRPRRSSACLGVSVPPTGTMVVTLEPSRLLRWMKPRHCPARGPCWSSRWAALEIERDAVIEAVAARAILQGWRRPVCAAPARCIDREHLLPGRDSRAAKVSRRRAPSWNSPRASARRLRQRAVCACSAQPRSACFISSGARLRGAFPGFRAGAPGLGDANLRNLSPISRFPQQSGNHLRQGSGKAVRLVRQGFAMLLRLVSPPPCSCVILPGAMREPPRPSPP